MDVIPVIDLRDGRVVRAQRGDRAGYRPIELPLAPTSDPLDVAAGLLSVFPFTTAYVADLDAIERRGDNRATLGRLRSAFPELRLWVDGGIAGPAAARAWLDDGSGDLVLGSESQPDAALAHALAGDRRVVLSLDFRGEAFLGPAALLGDAAAWPERVIVMTLARVGSGAGPDIERLRTVRDRAGARRVFAAGGVRNAGDLRLLRRLGIAGALVASSLHDGTLTGRDITALAAGDDKKDNSAAAGPRSGPAA